MTTHVRRGLNPVRRISFENPCTQRACTTTQQFVRGCARRNHPSRRVRAAKRAATFPQYTFPRLSLPPSLVARAVLLRDLNRKVFYSGGHYPPLEGTSSAMYLRVWERKKVTVASSGRFDGMCKGLSCTTTSSWCRCPISPLLFTCFAHNCICGQRI